MNNRRSKSGSGFSGGKKTKHSEGKGTAAPKAGRDRKEYAAKKGSVKKETDEIRLNKYISNSGVCSRREADLYIVSGNVKVNGNPVTELGYKVKPGDVVSFDGTVLTPEKKMYVLLNKPKGFSTGSGNEQNQDNVQNLIRTASKHPLLPIGRMDKTTIGLLLFTNDNDLIHKLSQPQQRSSKVYQVSLDRNLKYEDLEKIQSGSIQIDEYRVYVEEIAYVENQPKTEIGIKLKASNVKLVRALFEELNYNVLKVDRVMYGGLTKWNLPRGKWRYLTDEEVRNLKNN